MDILQEYRKKEQPIRDIIGCAFTVYNEFHQGLLESAYEAGLFHLLQKKGYLVERQKELPIYLQGEKLPDNYRMDLVVNGNIIVELKALRCIIDEHRKQLQNYMMLTHCSFGMLINFAHDRVYTEIYEYVPISHTVKRIRLL